MTGQPKRRPHPITNTDSLLCMVLDELEGLRGDMRDHFARAFPEYRVEIKPEGREKPAEGERATVRIEEPAPAAPPVKPVKKAAPRKATNPKAAAK